jgi:hypothetical protein
MTTTTPRASRPQAPHPSAATTPCDPPPFDRGAGFPIHSAIPKCSGIGVARTSHDIPGHLIEAPMNITNRIHFETATPDQIVPNSGDNKYTQ